MNQQQTKAAAALAAFDALYKNPVTGAYYIDGDEAQVAADLAAVVREQQEAINEALQQAINEALQQALERHDAYEQGLEDRPVVDAAVAAVEAHKSDLQYSAHEAIHGDSKAVQQVDEYLQHARTHRIGNADYIAGIKGTMEYLKKQPR